MRKIFYSLIAVFILFSSFGASANEIDDCNFKDYVYNDEGKPVFIKVYKAQLSNPNKSHSSAKHESMQWMWSQMAQEDMRGSYLPIPITKKKSKDKDGDKDESGWECPYCGRYNEASSNTCGTSGCVLHR